MIGPLRGKVQRRVRHLFRLDHAGLLEQLLPARLVAEFLLRDGLVELDDAVGAGLRRVHAQHAHAVLDGASTATRASFRRGQVRRARAVIAPERSRPSKDGGVDLEAQGPEHRYLPGLEHELILQTGPGSKRPQKRASSTRYPGWRR